MNIFALDDSPYLSAIWQHDRHVVKMTVESAQLLSWACRLDERFKSMLPPQYVDQLYRESHKNNPLTLWTASCDANFAWLALHGLHLVGEKHRRFPLNGMHKSYPLLTGFGAVAAKLAGVERVWTRDANRNLIVDPAIVALANQHTPFFQAMQQFPEYMVPGDSTLAYRRFYLGSKLFQDRVTWTKCDSLPEFILEAGVRHADSIIRDRIKHLIQFHATPKSGPVRDATHNNIYIAKPNPKAILKFSAK